MKHTTFTIAEAAAASAPSPCSVTVMNYTLPDERLAAALKELGVVMALTDGTYQVAKAAAKPRARAAKTAPAESN